MSNSKVMKWVTGAMELFLGIPIIGGLVVIGFWYVPLAVMLILHIVTLMLSNQNQEAKYGSVLGIVTSLVAWIPFLGMIMHLVTGVMLMVSATKNEQPPSNLV